MARLDEHLERLEREVTARGGTVHWARDANEANAIVTRLVRATGEREVVKVKSMVTQEIGLNEALEAAGIAAYETDLAELIVQLGHDKPSHILVPAIHRNRAEIREIFRREMGSWGLAAPDDLTDEPRRLAMAARAHLRQKFLTAKVGISGANFGVAETGTLVVVESEGNGRMCLTLPETLITVMGIEKVVPTWRDLEVFLQLLPRSSTGERMNPYTSAWTGVTGRRRRRRTAGVPPRAAGQRAHRDPRRRRRSRGAALHQVQRLHERLPGLRAHRRARLRVGLPRPDRRGAVAAADRRRGQRVAALRLVAVRRVLRRLPGAHRHPVDPGPPARPARRGAARGVAGPVGRAGRHGRRVVGDVGPEAVRRGGAGVPGGPRARPPRVGRPDPFAPAAAVGLDVVARRTGPAAETFREWWARTREAACAGRERRRAAEVLRRIRAANARAGVREVPAVERAYRRPASTRPAPPTCSTFRAPAGRLPGVGDPDRGSAELRDAVVATLAGLASTGPCCCRRACPRDWAPDGVRDDGALTPADLDRMAAVVTACTVGCAETGTIVLDGSPDQGRRAITLVPDVHVCVVRADQVVHSRARDAGPGRATRPSPWSAGRPPPATSSWTGWRACTDRAPSPSSW